MAAEVSGGVMGVKSSPDNCLTFLSILRFVGFVLCMMGLVNCLLKWFAICLFEVAILLSNLIDLLVSCGGFLPCKDLRVL